jgi:hypothetical protein
MIASFCCVVAMSSHAEKEAEFSPGVYLGWQHDSNLFRLPDSVSPPGAPRGVADYQYGASLEAALPVSQQFFSLDAHAVRNHYSDADFLDYTNLAGNADWRWRYGHAWSGDIQAEYHRDLVPFDEFQSLVESRPRIRDIRRLAGGSASAVRKLTLDWDLGVTLRHDASRDESGFEFLDRDLSRGTVDLTYHGTRDPNDYLGLRVNSRWVRFPHREIVSATQVDNAYREDDLLIRFNWVATERSTLTADLGYSMLHHREFSSRDFSGPTGSLTYRFTPTGNAGAELGGWREIVAQTQTTASYMTEAGVRVKPYWRYSDQILFEGDLETSRREYKGDPLLGLASGVPLRSDRIRFAELSATYTPADHLIFKFSAHKERRNSNRDNKDYEYTLLAANVALNF